MQNKSLVKPVLFNGCETSIIQWLWNMEDEQKWRGQTVLISTVNTVPMFKEGVTNILAN